MTKGEGSEKRSGWEKATLGDTGSGQERAAPGAPSLGIVEGTFPLGSERMKLLKAGVQISSETLSLSGPAPVFMVLIPRMVVRATTPHSWDPGFAFLDSIHHWKGQEPCVMGTSRDCLRLLPLCFLYFNLACVQQILVEFLTLDQTLSGRGYH